MAGGFQSAGRRNGAKNRLSTKFIEALEADFQEHGEATIKVLRVESPDCYLKLIGNLVPRELELQVDNQLSNLSQDELELAIDYARKRLAERSIQLGIREEPTTIN